MRVSRAVVSWIGYGVWVWAAVSCASAYDVDDAQSAAAQTLPGPFACSGENQTLTYSFTSVYQDFYYADYADAASVGASAGDNGMVHFNQACLPKSSYVTASNVVDRKLELTLTSMTCSATQHEAIALKFIPGRGLKQDLKINVELVTASGTVLRQQKTDAQGLQQPLTISHRADQSIGVIARDAGQDVIAIRLEGVGVEMATLVTGEANSPYFLELVMASDLFNADLASAYASFCVEDEAL